MNLIATNLIAIYIAKHPDARVTLLSWLKQQPYLFREVFTGSDTSLYIGSGQSTADPDYYISYSINYSAKAALVTHVENNKEQQERLDREFAEAEMRNPGKVRRMTKTFTTIVHVPEPIADEEIHLNAARIDTSSATTIKTQPIDKYQIDADFVGIMPFDDVEAYALALDRATAIFNAQPGAPEFDELMVLLPRIQQYEYEQLKFPTLRPFEIVTQRLELFKMQPNELNIFADPNVITQFLAGDLELEDWALEKIYQCLGLRIMPGDRRFII
jgi:HTH-type transcriptional regulator/antitoxin HigA